MSVEELEIIDDGAQVPNDVEIPEEAHQEVQETRLDALDDEGTHGGGENQHSADGDEPRPPKRTKRDYQKRLDELTYQRKAAEEGLAAERARREMLEEELARIRGGGHGSSQQQDEDEEAALIRQRKAAWDDPNTDFSKIDEINDRLMEVRMDKRDARRQKGQSVRQTQDQAASEPPLNPSAQRWLEQNAWYNDPGNAHLSGEALRIHEDLRLREHYPVGEALYRELDRRLRDLPEFDDVLYRHRNGNGQERADAQEQTRVQSDRPPMRSVVASPSRGGMAPGQRVTGLTQYDRETMRTYNLDPTNRVHVEKYLKYRQPA